MVAGQSDFAEHVKVGAGCRIGAQAGVMSDLEPGVVVVGSSFRPAKEFFREIATLKKLARPARF